MVNKKPIKIICAGCGRTFTALTVNALWCKECNEIRKAEINRLYMIRKREADRKKLLPHLRPKLSITEVLQMVEEYNKKNNAFVSYGKFVMMLEAKNGNDKNVHKY